MGYRQEIVQEAKQYIGQTEIQPNKGFTDPLFAAKMNKVGFYSSASWCGFFDMLVVFDVYAESKWLPLLKKYMSASTHQMWANFLASPEFHVSHTPKQGSIAIWQDGQSTKGHTGLVDIIEPLDFKSIEGNTNQNGSANGFEVAENKHSYNFNPNGFHLLGFVWLPDTEELSTVQEYKQSLK